jgi:hypothetical protein
MPAHVPQTLAGLSLVRGQPTTSCELRSALVYSAVPSAARRTQRDRGRVASS